MPLGVSRCPLQSAAATPARVVGDVAGGGERFAAELVDGLAHDGTHRRPLDVSGLGGRGEPLGDQGGEFVEPAVDLAPRSVVSFCVLQGAPCGHATVVSREGSEHGLPGPAAAAAGPEPCYPVARWALNPWSARCAACVQFARGSLPVGDSLDVRLFAQ
ncbi:hypothetical protein GCM10010346_62230 [Streptomyces chryseus]|uniref:Uncharacterized protein n=1 Tax=Streptomyces chryseus TaxID=68186 RepID=A0ABQ3ECH4_9ACTN|nr:hypothetical protein GCM10010346_62230 [Streptomyces chryseus]